MASTWQTRFSNHSLWALVDQLREQVGDLEMPSDVDAAESLARVLWLLEVLQAHRDNDEVRGYTPTMLDNVHRMLSGNVQNQLNQYLADTDANAANLTTAAQQIDTVLDQMGTWPPLPSRGAAIAAGQMFSQYEKASRRALRELNKQVEDLESHLSEMRGTVTQEQSALAKVRTDFERHAGEAIDSRLQEVTDRYAARVQKSIDSIATDEAEAERSRAELEGMKQEGRKTIEAIANRAVATDYRKNARNKSFAGWVWDIAGLVVGGTPLVLILVHFFNVGAAGQSGASALTLTRIGISIAAVGLAALCFRRGSVNHKEARRAKRADIRLTTVHPFIANQDSEVQAGVMEGMADRIYLQGILDEESSTYDPTLLQQYIEKFRARRERERQGAAASANT